MITEKEAAAAIPQRSCFTREYIRWAARSSDCNLAYHIASVLTLLSVSVPIDFGVPFGRTLPCNIYALIVGPSTTSRKTAAIRLAQAILTAALPVNVGEMPGSPEGLVDELAARAQQLIFWGEFGQFLAGAERGYLRPLKTRMTEIFDGDPIGRKRANGVGETVLKPRLSILAGIAPGYLEGHSEAMDWSEGFLGRFYTIFASRERHYIMPTHDLASENRLIAMLKDYAEPHRLMVSGPGPCLGLTPDALAMWSAWQLSVEKLARDNPHRLTAPALGRAVTMALKISALLAFDFGHARNGDPWHVGEEELHHATAMTDLHVKSVLEIGDLLAIDRDMRDRRRLLMQINGKPIRFGSAIKLAGMTKRRGTEILQTLEEEGTVRRVVLAGTHEPLFQRVADDEVPEARPEGPLLASPAPQSLFED